jgi:hypothetical protein
MTLLNVFVTSDAAHLATDGAHYGLDGRLHSIGQKVLTLPHLSCAVAMRGPSFVLPNLAAGMGSFGTFDELVAVFPEFLKEALDALGPLFAKSPFDRRLETVLAGWSHDYDRPQAYVLATHGGVGLPPWEMVDAGVWLTPADPSLITRLHAIGVDIDSLDFDPELDGLAVAHQQRCRRWDIAQTGQPIVCIGGFLQLTSVAKDTITSRIVHRWPDQIGELIDEREALCPIPS